MQGVGRNWCLKVDSIVSILFDMLLKSGTVLLPCRSNVLIVQKFLELPRTPSTYVFSSYKPTYIHYKCLDTLMRDKHLLTFIQDQDRIEEFLSCLARDALAEYKELARAYRINLPYRFKFCTTLPYSYTLLVDKSRNNFEHLSLHEQVLLACMA